MANETHVGISDLPHFTITSVAAEERDVFLGGVFNHLKGVKQGRAWLYRPNDQSLEGDLASLDTATRAGQITVAREGLPAEFRQGASFPYFYGYFEPRVVDMILDQRRVWVRVKYEPTDSVRIAGKFPEETVYGEKEVGAPIPHGFRIVTKVPGGWSKETCEICQASIGPRHQPFGYREKRDVAAGLNSAGFWLCERDYERYAFRHDLGFLLE